MQRLIDKLKDALNELAEASCHLPQDGPYNHIKNAQVAIESVSADLASVPDLEPQLAAWKDTASALGMQSPADMQSTLAKQAEEIGALEERLAAPISEAVAASAPAADTPAFAPVL